MWRYFGFLGYNSKAITKKVAVCRLCPDKKFQYAGNATDLITHLERHHKTEYSDYLKASEKLTSELL